MKEIRFSKLKSERLKAVRGVSFEELLSAKLICIKDHPVKQTQYIMYFDYKGYVWMIPYVEDQDHIFLKTLYPSRKYTKMYRRGIFP
jgi:hypothetical protein